MPFNKNFSSDILDYVRENPEEKGWGDTVMEAMKYSFLSRDSAFLNKLEQEYDENPLLVSLIYNVFKYNSDEWKKKLLKDFGGYVLANYPKIELLNPIGPWRKGNNRQIKAIVQWYYKQIYEPEHLSCESCESIMIPSFTRAGRFCCFNSECDDYLIPIYENHCHSCLEDVTSRYDAECGNCHWIICSNCNCCADPRFETCDNQTRIDPRVDIEIIREYKFDSIKAFESKLIEKIYDKSKKAYHFYNRSNIYESNCGRGKDIIRDETSLDTYFALYLPMHVSKLYQAFSNTNLDDFLDKDTTIIDWGCGQGIGTLSIFEYLINHQSYSIPIKNIILVEPSEIAINRAKEIVLKSEYENIDEGNIKLVNKDINSITVEDIGSNMDNCINIFSNILDVESIDISNFSKKFVQMMGVHTLCICVSPNYKSARENINMFYNALSHRGIENDYFCESPFMIESHDYYLKKKRRMRRTQYCRTFTLN